MNVKLIVAFLVLLFLLYRSNATSYYGGVYSACSRHKDCSGGLRCMNTKNYGKQCR